MNTYRKYPLTKPIKNISTKMGQQPQCFPMIDYMIKIIIMIRLIMVGQGGRSCVKAQRALAEKFGLMPNMPNMHIWVHIERAKYGQVGCP